MRKSKVTLPIILVIIGLCLACVCLGLGMAYFFGDAIISWFSPTPPPVVVVPATRTPTQANITPSAETEWTVIVYSDADDDVLEYSMWFDVNEMELVGSSSDVNIVVQIDRYAAGFSGDGNWTGARRLYITRDDDLQAIHSPVMMDMGELDMGKPQTLVDFVTWTIQNYPARKYALVMSDHGGGWTGGFVDATSSSKLSIAEIADALDLIRQNTGVDKFELFGFDACLMGQVEIFGTFYPVSNYMVASEEVIPDYGWAYAGWLAELVNDPSMDGYGLSQAIVSTYVTTDTQLTYARATPEQIQEEESTTTLSAVESARVPEMIAAMNEFINVMASIDQGQVAQARTYARSYYSIFGEDVTPPYLDVLNFAQMLSSISGSAEVEQAALQLETAVTSAVVAEKHGSTMSGSNGVSFYFPDSEIYQYTEMNDEFDAYGDMLSIFLQVSSWDEFMAYHYTGVAYSPEDGQVLTPGRSADVVGPGASELGVGPILISDTEITGDELVTVSTTVTGDAAYIYTVLYFYNPDTESYWIGDITYYIADDMIESGGVYFPDYGDSPIQVEYEWSPTLYMLTDGTHEAYALLEPAEYYNADGLTVYAVFGIYTPASTGTPVDAMLYFDADGNYLYAYAFPDTDNDGASTPAEIRPQPGDNFTDYVQLIAFDDNDEPYYDYVASEDVWTWGDVPFSFFAAYPVDGEYAVGILVYDFDNNFIEEYAYINYQR